MLSTTLNLVPLRWRYYTQTGTVGGVSLARPQMAVSAIIPNTYTVSALGSWSGGYVLLTTFSATGWRAGDRISITGAQVAGYNKIFDIKDVLSTTVFKLRAVTQLADDTPATGPTIASRLNEYLVTSNTHRLLADDQVRISGANQASINQVAQVVSVVDVNNVVLLIPGNTKDSGARTAVTGTVKLNQKCIAQRAIITATSGTIVIGPDSNADAISLALNGSYTIEMPNGSKFDLADWYVKNAQTAGVLFV